MDLILWRHAEAAEAGDDGDDLRRPLTPRGERQAARMADWLERHLSAGTRILVSPAKRAQQTARALERRFTTLPSLAPEASVEALLLAARWPDGREPVLIVGHQPTLGLTAARLLAGATRPMSLKKGAVWWLRERKRDGDSGVVLVAVRAPEMD